MSVNPNAPFGLLPAAPVQTRINADDPDQFAVPALQRSGPSLTGMGPQWAGWFNTLRQWLFLNIPDVINNRGAYSSADPIANGAVGDGVTDDTATVQQTINNTGGVLYLRFGYSFLVSSTITIPSTAAVLYIFGGGSLVSTNSVNASPIVNIAGATPGGILIVDVGFRQSFAGGGCLQFVSQTSANIHVDSCFFACPGGGGIGIAASGGPSAGQLIIADCVFQTNITSPIQLTNEPNANIVGCQFLAAPTTPVTASGTTTYNMRGCNPALDYYNPQVPRALCTNNAAQTFTTGVAAALTFNTDEYNFGSVHNTVTNNSRFTAPVAGNYYAWGQVEFNGTGSFFLSLSIRKNGSLTTPQVVTQLDTSGGNSWQIQVHGTFQLAAGDYLEFWALQGSGGNLNTFASVCAGSMTLLSQP